MTLFHDPSPQTAAIAQLGECIGAFMSLANQLDAHSPVGATMARAMASKCRAAFDAVKEGEKA